MNGEKSLIPLEKIENTIRTIRGHKMILDTDLAGLYEVETKVLIQAVKRNLDRFPEDFMFQLSKAEYLELVLQKLTPGEYQNLRSQIVTSKSWGGRRYLPYAFTEQGVAMLSSVLRSSRAVQVNIEIMRTFIRLRQILSSNVELAKKLDMLEKKYDAQFRVVFEAIRRLMLPPEANKRPLGFRK